MSHWNSTRIPSNVESLSQIQSILRVNFTHILSNYSESQVEFYFRQWLNFLHQNDSLFISLYSMCPQILFWVPHHHSPEWWPSCCWVRWFALSPARCDCGTTSCPSVCWRNFWWHLLPCRTCAKLYNCVIWGENVLMYAINSYECSWIIRCLLYMVWNTCNAY